MRCVVILLSLVASAISRNIGARILAGKPTTIEEYSFQVSLESLTNHFCGGSIISKDYIITIANCIVDRKPSTFNVRYGTTFRKKGGNTSEILDFTIHPNFSESTCEFDVAIISVKEPLVLSATASPINLVPADKRPRHGDMLVAIGWGFTQYQPTLADQLQAVRIPMIENKLCALAYEYYPANVTDNMLCAGGGVDSGPFAGDCGGPLLNDKKDLVGLTSWGFAWGNVTGYPAVFTDITSPSVRFFINNRTKLLY